MTQRQFEDRYTDYPFNPIGHGTSLVSSYADADGFVEVAEAPTGFMVIKRHVFGRLMEKYPELNYVPDGPPNNPQRHLYWRFFDCMIDPDSGRYLSEDYTFCRRWRDVGGKVFVDSHCKLGHLGQRVPRDLAESLSGLRPRQSLAADRWQGVDKTLPIEPAGRADRSKTR